MKYKNDRQRKAVMARVHSKTRTYPYDELRAVFPNLDEKQIKNYTDKGTFEREHILYIYGGLPKTAYPQESRIIKKKLKEYYEQ